MIGNSLAVSSGLRAVALALPLAVFPGPLSAYEPPKAWWLQVIVIITTLAWILERAQRTRTLSTGHADRPLLVLRWLLAMYAAWWLFTTVASVAPGQSLLGSFDRGFGLLTVLATIALFPLVQSSCRTADVRSLVDSALVGSVPVCLIALGEAIGLDALPATYGSATSPLHMRSTIGHYIFLGSYLALLIPLATVRCLVASAATIRVPYGALGAGTVWVAGVLLLVRVASAVPLAWLLLPLWGGVAAVAWDRVEQPVASERLRGIPGAALFGALAAVQVLVVVLSGARGPFLGLIAALATVGGVLWWRRRGLHVRVAATGVLVVLVCLGVVMAAAGSRRGILRTIPVMERLTMPSGSAAHDSVKERLETWAIIAVKLGRQFAGVEVIPDQNPWLRSAVGYGLDTQSFILDSFVTEQRGGRRGARGRLVFDRAHDVLLDHLATGGLVAAAIWIAVLAGVLMVGARRLSTGADEGWALRLGCFGAVVGHVVEGVTGIETIVPSALFWMLAAVLTAPAASSGLQPVSRARYAPALWGGGLVAVAAIGCFNIAATTVWLLGSMSYARGVALASAGRFLDARLQLEHAAKLVPWLPSPRGMAGQAALRVAELEPDPARRAAIARQTEALVATTYGGTAVSSEVWLVRGRLALARAGAGEPQQLAVALAAFARADRLRAHDVRVLVPWAVALLADGQPARARALAERVVSMNDDDWAGWVVVARASARLGDHEREKEAEARASRFVPRERLQPFEQLR